MIIGGKPWNPGEMRTSVTLKKRVSVEDAGGFKSDGWTTLASVYAKWVNVHGREAWDANAAGAERAATVTIRYQADMDTSCAVEMGGETYQVISVDDIQNRHELMELKVKLWQPG